VTFDPTPLLKGFGAAADVIGQIATDKAINGRRNSKGSTKADGDLAILRGDFVRSEQDEAERAEILRGGVDITDGQLIEDHIMGGSYQVPHELGRVPVGAIVIKRDPGGAAAPVCTGTSADDITMNFNNVTVSLWIF
jgi:hypothetical protein